MEWLGSGNDGVEFGSVVRRAIEVIGDRDEAMRWLGTPVRALNFATPVSLLRDSAGRKQVLAVLDARHPGSVRA